MTDQEDNNNEQDNTDNSVLSFCFTLFERRCCCGCCCQSRKSILFLHAFFILVSLGLSFALLVYYSKWYSALQDVYPIGNPSADIVNRFSCLSIEGDNSTCWLYFDHVYQVSQAELYMYTVEGTYDNSVKLTVDDVLKYLSIINLLILIFSTQLPRPIRKDYFHRSESSIFTVCTILQLIFTVIGLIYWLNTMQSLSVSRLQYDSSEFTIFPEDYWEKCRRHGIGCRVRFMIPDYEQWSLNLMIMIKVIENLKTSVGWMVVCCILSIICILGLVCLFYMWGREHQTWFHISNNRVADNEKERLVVPVPTNSSGARGYNAKVEESEVNDYLIQVARESSIPLSNLGLESKRNGTNSRVTPKLVNQRT